MISSNAAENRPASDRSRADMTWERTQEQALEAFINMDTSAAKALWAKALEIAERHFDRGDPRLATSLSNHGFALLRQGQTHQANICFQRADAAWEESWCWVPWMTPSSGPGDVDAEPFDRAIQEAFYAVIERGREITRTMWREHRLAEAIGDDWATVKPKSMNDVRRLFSAVYLMPTTAHRRGHGGDRRHAA